MGGNDPAVERLTAMETASLTITGYRNRTVPNTFICQALDTAHLGIILPGYRYSVDMASLDFAGQILLEQGADVLRVEYVYSQTDYSACPEAEQAQWLSTDVQVAAQVGLAQRSYDRITLVGKSLGTLAMGHLLADPRFHSAACIWQTPILALEWLRQRILDTKPRSLFIIGTADQFYDPAYLAELEAATRGQNLVLEGVDHSLGVPGSVSQSIHALSRIVTEMQRFL
jgi:predicted alpha/beta-hydrolase family hydrolase